VPSSAARRGSPQTPAGSEGWGDRDSGSQQAEGQVLCGRGNTWKDGELLRRKRGSEPIRDILGIPADTKAENTLVYTKGSNLPSDVYCPRSTYCYDTVIIYIGL